MKRTETEAPSLSRRLLTIAGMVTEGSRLADIGTDHALIPVRLLMEGRIRYAYCCDIGRGPLLRAEQHIREWKVEDRAETRLSDGLAALTPGEADSVLIAGMGGLLIEKILRDCDSRRGEDGSTFLGTVREWILSPHSEWDAVRKYLCSSGRCITEERFLKEDGKFYVVIRAVPGDGELPYEAAAGAGLSPETAEHYGPLLCLHPEPVFTEYLETEKKKRQMIREKLERAEQLSGGSSDSRMSRFSELDHEEQMIEEALKVCTRTGSVRKGDEIHEG